MKIFFKKGIDNPPRRVYKWHMKGNGVFEFTLRGAFSFLTKLNTGSRMMKGKGVFRAIRHERRFLYFRSPKGAYIWIRRLYLIISAVTYLTTES